MKLNNMNNEELIKKWKPVLSYDFMGMPTLPLEKWADAARQMEDIEQAFIKANIYDIDALKANIFQIRLDVGKPLERIIVGGRIYVLDSEHGEHYKEEALKWEFRYKQEKNQNLDHEKDYFEIWKLIKEPNENVVDAVKRVIKERDEALKKLD